MSSKAKTSVKPRNPSPLVLLLVLLGVFCFLFWRNFNPNVTLFSNDGPLGRLMSQCHQLPARFTGCWDDLNAIGLRGGAATPNLTYGLLFCTGPLWFSKLYVPFALLLLGLAAWCFFRRLNLAPAACALGGIACALNSSFFSDACWGVASHEIAVAMTFLALAALVDTEPGRRWIRTILGGLAVGLAVAEGADVGAIFSLYVAAFIIYQAIFSEGRPASRVGVGLGRTGLVSLCAALVAAHAISELVGTNITGVNVGQQDTKSETAHWDWATQWSLPKRETLGMIVPGLFGYRMETPNGGNYWGTVGRAAAWDRYVAAGKQGPPPTGFKRYSGGGAYAGVAVVLIAIWSAVQSFRRKEPLFSLAQRRWIWFWLGIAFISLLLAFGRHAPFYGLIYRLPYFSTIRNPAKFLSLVSVSIIILFAYGVDGLWRTYMRPAQKGDSRWPGLRSWWQAPAPHEARWMQACILVLVGSLIAWGVYAAFRSQLVQYLQLMDFEAEQAGKIALFSVKQVGWFLFFFVLSIGFMALMFSRAFHGSRARWAAMVLGLLIVTDLGRANLPWIIYWDVSEKYASNTVVDFLRERPYESRVTFLPFMIPSNQGAFPLLYKNEWMQHLFPYYNVQSLDVVQMPRLPKDLAEFVEPFSSTNGLESAHLAMRYWQITNTRYILGAAAMLPQFNRLAPEGTSFKIVRQFTLTPKPGIAHPSRADQVTVKEAANGLLALFEFDGALPRAQLFSAWQLEPNNAAALHQLSNMAIDPRDQVLVDGNIEPSQQSTNQQSGSVEFEHYAPKDILLKANASQRSVLLLNDRYDPHWVVRVDGRQAPLLRCNDVMRGVLLEPGAHEVEFRFQTPLGPLCVSSLAVLGGVLLLGFVGWSGREERVEVEAPKPTPAGAGKKAKREPGRRRLVTESVKR